MKRLEIIRRVRSMTRDFSNSIFREQDIIDFINEGISRFKQVIPELKGLKSLLVQQQEPKLIPEPYRHLLAVYSAARCFSQDESHYQATVLMNEFEVKLGDLAEKILSGDITIVDEQGNEITNDGTGGIDYIDLYPYWGIKGKESRDEGVDY